MGLTRSAAGAEGMTGCRHAAAARAGAMPGRPRSGRSPGTAAAAAPSLLTLATLRSPAPLHAPFSHATCPPPSPQMGCDPIGTMLPLTGNVMDRQLGHIQVPAASMSFANPVGMLLSVVLYDRVIAPIAYKMRRPIKPMSRIGARRVERAAPARCCCCGGVTSRSGPSTPRVWRAQVQQPPLRWAYLAPNPSLIPRPNPPPSHAAVGIWIECIALLAGESAGSRAHHAAVPARSRRLDQMPAAAGSINRLLRKLIVLPGGAAAAPRAWMRPLPRER